MERLIAWLPKRPQPLHVRFVFATVAMAVGVALQLAQVYATALPGLFILFLAIFFCALGFGRNTGFYATLLGAVSAYATLRGLYPTSANLVSVLIFIAGGFAVSAVSEALRNSFERAFDAERASQMLLRELQHRTQNMLATMVSLLELQARSSGDTAVQRALETAAGRVRLQAEVQRHLDLAGGDAVDISEYLQRICAYHEGALRGVRPIAIACRAEPLTVTSAKALALGLITNELITNALKYAFAAERPGQIEVVVTRESPTTLKLVVRDDGAGCPPNVPAGFGTRLVQLLSREHGGETARPEATQGCTVVVTMQT